MIIQDLARHELTQAQIATLIGVKQSTIAGLLSGAQKDMRWGNGERLRELHRRVCVLHLPPDASRHEPHQAANAEEGRAHA